MSTDIVEEYPNFLYFLKNRENPTNKIGNTRVIPIQLERVKLNFAEDLGKYKALLQLKNEIGNKNIKMDNFYIGQYFLIKRMDRLELTTKYLWNYNATKHVWFSSNVYSETFFNEHSRIAVYKCIGKDILNPNLKNINEKTLKTKAKKADIILNSKYIDSVSIKNNTVYLKRKEMLKLLENDIEQLGMKTNFVNIRVSGI